MDSSISEKQRLSKMPILNHEFTSGTGSSVKKTFNMCSRPYLIQIIGISGFTILCLQNFVSHLEWPYLKTSLG